ncbi:MAG TPA: MupG family TIM beta-alpha barrel fold protein [Methylomusa anaerophila]|uniref:Outer surface protein n=1 Tax=Methylomusa anaerophila TaxID=1930071 RepID=A0A348AG46_9FIRM|nr:MupG family TIM beta-alpha barrel fold protein [Methylomusa anaerophila]BBB90044.1 hypothetical protein MAMMFC1_00692 [Methylomusa anaerophila]HML88229.1 MupG family TIM beta-alpha barrel fold protein [Methylomusa anaerophila]
MTVEKGISVYAGLGYPVETIKRHLEMARDLGYSRLFTSLHIPEADQQAIIPEFRSIIGHAGELGFRVTADISPRAFSLLGLNYLSAPALNSLGIDILRLDFGFTPAEIARLTRESALHIELNASTINTTILAAILSAGAVTSRITACHNFYPRPETGLSYELFQERTLLCQQYNIPVAAFIPSGKNPRGPIHQGLPTLEQHRSLSPVVAAKHFLAGKLVDCIFFGDPLAPPEELASVASLADECVELNVQVESGLSQQELAILFSRHTNRTDPGEHVIRSQEARGLCTGIIPARPVRPRATGSVTIDNAGYLRYMGELQVAAKDLPPDPRVNIAATVVKEELFLLKYITPGRPFRFKEVAVIENQSG